MLITKPQTILFSTTFLSQYNHYSSSKHPVHSIKSASMHFASIATIKQAELPLPHLAYSTYNLTPYQHAQPRNQHISTSIQSYTLIQMSSTMPPLPTSTTILFDASSPSTHLKHTDLQDQKARENWHNWSLWDKKCHLSRHSTFKHQKYRVEPLLQHQLQINKFRSFK